MAGKATKKLTEKTAENVRCRKWISATLQLSKRLNRVQCTRKSENQELTESPRLKKAKVAVTSAVKTSIAASRKAVPPLVDALVSAASSDIPEIKLPDIDAWTTDSGLTAEEMTAEAYKAVDVIDNVMRPFWTGNV